MSWIEEVGPEDAQGALAEVYARIARGRGRVSNILRIQSLHPAGLREHDALYRTLMFGPSPLSRSEREAIAVAVSRENECHY
jgi:alkylhydroperoxidase family enzyme